MLLEGYLALLTACLVAFHWVLFHTYWVPALAALGGLLTIPLVLALPFAASVLVRVRQGSFAGFVALTAFYLTVELALSRGSLAFPWPLLGHTHARFFLFNQMAALAGVPGLTLWILSLNGLVWALIQTRTARCRLLIALFILPLLAAPAAYGMWRLQHLPSPHDATSALLVQPARPAPAWAVVDDQSRIDTLLALSKTALDTASSGPPELVIWPETALPPAPRSSAQYAQLQRWTTRRGVALLTGAIRPASSPSDRRLFYNSAVLMRPGDSLQIYDKNYLVPFAERVPLADRFPWLHTLAVPAGGVAGYRPGSDQPLLRGDDFALGALICFESAFGHHARNYVHSDDRLHPADFLVVLSQDGWWGRSLGYRQHLAFTQLRAIETQRAVVSVTATGTTALIRPSGQIALDIPWMKRTAERVAIPHYRGSTFYSRHGDGLSGGALALSLLVLGWLLALRLTQSRFLDLFRSHQR